MKTRFLASIFTIAAIALFTSFAILPQAKAAELIMIEQENCPWCEAWNDEIGQIYHKTAEGKRAPLRRIDIHEKKPTDLTDITLGNFTPTFVLWEDGKEVSRIRGYPGDEFFWYLLGQMLDKLPDSIKKPTG